MKYLLFLFLMIPFSGYSQLERVDTIEETTILEDDIMGRTMNAPKITEDFFSAGTIFLRVCVDNNGDVLKADLIREWSTDYTEELIRIARENAFKYKFSKSDLLEQCGTMTYKFKLKDEN